MGKIQILHAALIDKQIDNSWHLISLPSNIRLLCVNNASQQFSKPDEGIHIASSRIKASKQIDKTFELGKLKTAHINVPYILFVYDLVRD